MTYNGNRRNMFNFIFSRLKLKVFCIFLQQMMASGVGGWNESGVCLGK